MRSGDQGPTAGTSGTAVPVRTGGRWGTVGQCGGYNTRWALAALSAMPVAIAVAIAPVPAANADDHDDDFLLALKHNGIVATGDPAALVDWAHWTCDQLDQGAKKEYIVAWLGQYHFSDGGGFGALEGTFVREAALYYCPQNKQKAGW